MNFEALKLSYNRFVLACSLATVRRQIKQQAKAVRKEEKKVGSQKPALFLPH